jgi:hypothetical protein
MKGELSRTVLRGWGAAMLLRLPDPILVVVDYHNDRSKSSLEQPSRVGFLFMTRPQLIGLRQSRKLVFQTICQPTDLCRFHPQNVGIYMLGVLYCSLFGRWV